MNRDLETERRLFQRISQGDEAAFAELFNEYTDSLYTYILKITKSDLWAEELLQDVWTQVWLNRNELATLEKPVAYLHRMARNRCLDWIRRNKLELKWQYYLQQYLHLPNTDASERLDYNSTNQLIHLAIAELPPQRKLIFELKYHSELTYEQIAEKLQISKNTVRNQMVSALQSIRQYLTLNGGLMVLLPVLSINLLHSSGLPFFKG